MNRKFSRHHRRAREKEGNRYRVAVIFLTLIIVVGGSIGYVGWAKHNSAAQQAFVARASSWWVERKARIEKKLANSHEKMSQTTVSRTKSSVPESVHFEFYSMLPNNGEREATEPAPIFSHESLERELAQEVRKTAYIIQTGIYSNVASADKTRQLLTQDGLASKVVKAYLDEHLVYRVQVGPYEEKDKINEAQSKLAARGIHGSIHKVGDRIA